MFNWHPVTTREDIERILRTLCPEYHPEAFSKIITTHVVGQLGGILLEPAPSEVDYLPRYSPPDDFTVDSRVGCTRIHFFASGVPGVPAKWGPSEVADISKFYGGYVTVRPIAEYALGPTILDPRITGVDGAYLNVASYEVPVAGVVLRVSGFPWMHQLPSVCVCAHVAAWSAFSHHAAKEALSHKLTLKAIRDEVHGANASIDAINNGMSLDDIHALFKPLVAAAPVRLRRALDPGEFLDELVAYIDSGFPVIAKLPKHEHSIVILGFSLKEATSVSQHQGDSQLRHLIDKFYVSDDHYFPYHSISNEITEERLSDKSKYAAGEIDAFIPLLPKGDLLSYIDAQLNFSIAIKTYRKFFASFPPRGETFLRVFMTSGSQMKIHMQESVIGLSITDTADILALDWPEYLWVAEVSLAKDVRCITAVLVISAIRETAFSMAFSSSLVVYKTSAESFFHKLTDASLAQPLNRVSTLLIYR
jgi:hypothetical protein